MSQQDKLLLIDGNSIINRAFYGVPTLTNKAGLHTNAVYGFLNILTKTMDEENPTHMLVAFDVKKPTFRHKMFEEYKGQRSPMPGELKEQVPVLKDVLKAMGITIKEEPGIEADDILGTMAKLGEKKGYDVTILSGDKDLLQLVTDKITVKIPKSMKGTTTVEKYKPADVIAKYGITPIQIIDLKGLMGDSSDNYPGVPGVGEKTALKLLTLYGTLENVLSNVDNISGKKLKENLANNVKLAELCKELATIKVDCKLGINVEDCKLENIYNEAAYDVLSKLEIKTFLSRFKLQNSGGNAAVEKGFAYVNKKEQFSHAVKTCLESDIVAFKLLLQGKNDDEIENSGQFTFVLEEKPRILGLVLACNSKMVYFCRVGDEIGVDDIREAMSKLEESCDTLVTNNLKAQLDEMQDVDITKYFDTEIASYVIDPLGKSNYSEDISMEYAEISMPTYELLFGKEKIASLIESKRKEVVRYYCYDALVSFLAFKPMRRKLKNIKSYELFAQVEMPLVKTLHNMEREGIYIKKDELAKYGDRLAEKIDELQADIYRLAGEEFNINSPKQLGVVLFEKLNLPYGKKTKTGYSTSAEVLEKLRVENPIVENILEYRQLSKLKSTYADGLSNYIDSDGRIRTTFNQTITATGRLSSTEPNLQNIPIRMDIGREIRKVFVPKQGYVFLDADYSQIELRVLAHMSGDDELIKAYRENADIHQTTASLVFHVPYDEVTELQRRSAKAVNFGIVYGISGFGLSRDLGITKKQAEQYIEDYFASYPKLKEYLDGLVDAGKNKGYVTSLYGRRRPIPELSSSNYMQRQFGERIAKNSPIQGTAADIIKIAMINVDRKLREKGLESRLILQIHDELLIETKEEEIEIVREILQSEMVNAAKLDVPLIAEVKQGSDWYTAK
ncbi:MAG: DNA polymerase I [Eubacterium sp.]|nr:DNA polymerase I [Eubacterium sp.]